MRQNDENQTSNTPETTEEDHQPPLTLEQARRRIRRFDTVYAGVLGFLAVVCISGWVGAVVMGRSGPSSDTFLAVYMVGTLVLAVVSAVVCARVLPSDSGGADTDIGMGSDWGI